jgi:hypothetical protein
VDENVCFKLVEPPHWAKRAWESDCGRYRLEQGFRGRYALSVRTEAGLNLVSTHETHSGAALALVQHRAAVSG